MSQCRSFGGPAKWTQPPVVMLEAQKMGARGRRALDLPPHAGGKPNPGTKKDKRLKKNRRKK